MKYCQWLLALGVLFAGMSSCRSTKKITTVIQKKDTTQVMIPVEDHRADSLRLIRQVYQSIEKNRIDFKTFSGKIKVDFEGSDGKKTDFNAFIRLKKDSMIWISINMLLGIEGFRVLITPDSVKVLNKLDRVAQLRSVGYLQEVAKIPLKFQELQDLLVGNPVFLDSQIVSYKNEERAISLLSIGQLFKHLLTVSSNDFSLLHSKLDDTNVARARTCDITYGGYESKSGLKFSTYRRITASEKSKLDITLQFKQWDFNLDLNFPFTIPRNYKRQ